MKLDSKYIDILESKWTKARICPICGNTLWQINDTIFELPEFHGGNVVLGTGSVFPVIPISCSNCGYSFFINAILGKAIKPQEKAEIKDERKEDAGKE